ncbi:MAG: Fe-S cluster assembly protein IscX [Planctomycetota bacterium]|jgi:FeS assembly protein IscX|nr:Fe-S assembly protein IscX [Planctomycetota bacterium]MDP6369546.1 Fe-S cluster assembly protein IscX [Planctomycetota bacterium]MDP6520408.1 Fe-S cluster assembly protein IscX [Planctomycetota bacterium]MDP6838220.1 Fe-S cluster assembly protein IscX [Planctomycetota bacterium]MDP6956791.1 Fe-S cluster assembly protein IscX [Planctomycetota bacterium]
MNDSEITWSDAQEIGFRLWEAHPEVNPLAVRFTDLHAWVMALDGFRGKAEESSEGALEAIQMAWLDEVEE